MDDISYFEPGVFQGTRASNMLDHPSAAETVVFSGQLLFIIEAVYIRSAVKNCTVYAADTIFTQKTLPMTYSFHGCISCSVWQK